jgi:hypothetical protein
VSELTPEAAIEADLAGMSLPAGLTDEEKAHQHDDWQDDEYAIGAFCPFCGAVAGSCGHRAGG